MAEANKIIFNGKVLTDMSGDTATAAQILKGYTAHIKTGQKVTGTLVIGSTEKPEAETIVRNSDGSVTETLASGETITTVKQSDGSVIRTSSTGRTVTTVRNSDGSVTETCKDSTGTLWTVTYTKTDTGSMKIAVA